MKHVNITMQGYRNFGAKEPGDSEPGCYFKTCDGAYRSNPLLTTVKPTNVTTLLIVQPNPRNGFVEKRI